MPWIPTIEYVRGNRGGFFSDSPLGVILHGTRSSQRWSLREEYDATVRYVRNGAGGLGWNLTCGDGVLAVHLDPGEWGWNARGASRLYLAVEFAQPNLGDEIADGQVRAFCWWFRKIAREEWPALPELFPEHYELPEGRQDGKTDCDPRRPGRLAARIEAELRRADAFSSSPAISD